MCVDSTGQSMHGGKHWAAANTAKKIVLMMMVDICFLKKSGHYFFQVLKFCMV